MKMLSYQHLGRRAGAIAVLAVLLTACSGTMQYEGNTGSVLLTLFWFFLLVIWFWLLITVFADIFRREDVSGWGKAGWTLLIIVLPLLGILIYLIARPKQLAQDDRESKAAAAAAAAYQQSIAESRAQEESGGGTA